MTTANHSDWTPGLPSVHSGVTFCCWGTALLENERLIGLKDNMLQTGHSDDIALFTDFSKGLTFLVSLKVFLEDHTPWLQSCSDRDAPKNESSDGLLWGWFEWFSHITLGFGWDLAFLGVFPQMLATPMNSFHHTWEDVHLCSEMRGHSVVHINPVTKWDTAASPAGRTRGFRQRNAGVYSKHRVAAQLVKVTVLFNFEVNLETC